MQEESRIEFQMRVDYSRINKHFMRRTKKKKIH